MEYFAAIKQIVVDLNMLIWKVLQVISLSEKARFRTMYINSYINISVWTYICTQVCHILLHTASLYLTSWIGSATLSKMYNETNFIDMLIDINKSQFPAAFHQHYNEMTLIEDLLWVYLFIMISFGYKFGGFASSLYIGNSFKEAGFEVNGVCFAVQGALHSESA